jgi:GntR family transcriptional regulator
MATRHQEIADKLRSEIVSAVLAEGSVLPPESELAARYGVSRGTVRHAWARANGLRPAGTLISKVRRPATRAEASSLRVAEGIEVLHTVRLRHLDELPVMVERTTWAPWVADAIDALAPHCPSITLALEGQGVVFAQADHVIDAMAAGTVETTLLGVRRGGPLLRHRRVSTTPSNEPIESADDRYVGGAYAFSLHNSIQTNPLSRRTPSPR